VLPRVALEDLENDPEQLSLAALLLLQYAEAKRVLEDGQDEAMKAWKGSQIMDAAKRNHLDLMAERRERWAVTRKSWGAAPPVEG
jgi:hypothetical protein